MKQLAGTVSWILFYLFVAVILIWTASLTLTLLQTVLPRDPITPYFGLALFDGGAVVWLFVFLGYAKGLPQRAISILMLIFDLVGVVLMSGAEIFLGGQNFTEVPRDLGTIIIWAIGIWTAANVVAAYSFHVFDPHSMKEIEVQTAKDKVEQRSLKILQQNMDEISAQIAGELGERMKRQAIIELGVENIFRKPVIEVEPKPEPKQFPIGHSYEPEHQERRKVFWPAQKQRTKVVASNGTVYHSDVPVDQLDPTQQRRA